MDIKDTVVQVQWVFSSVTYGKKTFDFATYYLLILYNDLDLVLN